MREARKRAGKGTHLDLLNGNGRQVAGRAGRADWDDEDGTIVVKESGGQAIAEQGGGEGG